MIGHLGTRVSALLDGQLSTEDEERAWAHVHACHQCRDLVEREGWVKTQLAGLTWGLTVAPDGLKGSLLAPQEVRSPGDVFLVGAPRRHRGMAVLSGGALGVTVIGLLALGAAPAAAPVVERRTPTTSLVRPAEGPRLTQGGEGRSGGGSRNRAHVASFGAPGVTIPW